MTGASKFRLQALLDHKARIERERRREWAAAADASRTERARLDGLVAQLNVFVYTQALRLQALRAEYLYHAIAAQEAAVRSSEAAEETARIRLRDAAIEKLALEKLKLRRSNAHAAAQDAAEQLELDEANRR